MIIPCHEARRRRSRRSMSVLAALGLVGAVVSGAAGHGPDPFFGGGPFAQNQDLRFKWRSGSEPPAAIKTAIKAAAADVAATKGSKAASFTYDAAGPNPIGYGLAATCGVNGIACFTRDAPTGFTMWLREQGHAFDWGTLKWCQTYTSPPNGCYDVETIALDEFGHVEGLGHHANFSTDSDYLDAVVQTVSRTKPTSGWNEHGFGRCDVAALQIQYDVTSWTAKYSTCLVLRTTLDLTPSPLVVAAGGTSSITATLRVLDDSTYGRLGDNPVSGRTVTLQRRAVGTTTWITVGTMAAGSSSGTYVMSQKPSSDTDYRAVFSKPSGEGLLGVTSAVARVYIGSSCTRALTTVPGTNGQCT